MIIGVFECLRYHLLADSIITDALDDVDTHSMHHTIEPSVVFNNRCPLNMNAFHAVTIRWSGISHPCHAECEAVTIINKPLRKRNES